MRRRWQLFPLYLVLVLFRNEPIAAGRNIFLLSMRYTNVSVTFSKAHYANVTAWVNAAGAFYTDMYAIRDTVKGFQIMAVIQLRLEDSQRYQTLFAHNLNVCQLLSKGFRENLIMAWMQNVIKYSNFVRECPFPKGYYYIHNFKLENGSIPAYLRPGSYRKIAHAYYGKYKSKKEVTFAHFTMDFEIF